ncbi:MAG: imidazolonepropionase [Acidobacteriota bacterium]
MILRNISRLAKCLYQGGQSEIHTVPNAALVCEGGRILWVGPESALPASLISEHEQVDAGGRLVIPGLIDCHTHLAFGGWRADEFVQRLQGRSYLEIAAGGGGIRRTVEATRGLTRGQLVERCLGFLTGFLQLGTTTVECKSGYGLDFETELRLLRVYADLKHCQPVKIVPTFLAHVIPDDYAAQRHRYVELLRGELIPEIARERLAESCDVFVEKSAFSIDEARSILDTAAASGLKTRLHADQLTDTGSAQLAADLKVLSADHLEHVSDSGIAALRGSGVVAVSLPLASLYLGTPPMPARRLIEAGVPVAVATDFNPGSAPSYHMPLAMMLACTLQRMTPEEALKGATIYAAKALGVEADRGSLEEGKSADFILIDADDVNHWLYHFRPNACAAVYVDGRKL